MSLPLWEACPDSYSMCTRCNGTGQIDCHWCDGKGTVVGPNHFIFAGTISRRFGLKVCTTCRGSGKQRCRICIGGSVAKG